MKQGKETARLVVEWVGRAKSSPPPPFNFCIWMACVGIRGGGGGGETQLVSRSFQAPPSPGQLPALCDPSKGGSASRVPLTVVARAPRSRGRGYEPAFSNANGLFYGCRLCPPFFGWERLWKKFFFFLILDTQVRKKQEECIGMYISVVSVLCSTGSVKP